MRLKYIGLRYMLRLLSVNVSPDDSGVGLSCSVGECWPPGQGVSSPRFGTCRWPGLGLASR